MCGSLLAYTLLDTLAAGDAFGDEVKPIAVDWLRDVNELGKWSSRHSITQQQWQQKVEELLKRVDLPDMLRALDMDKLLATVKYRERGERALHPKLPQVEGMPIRYVFGHQVFALTEGRSVPPHGHKNMATLFLVLKGKFQGRHYDKLHVADDHMIIRPTIDRHFQPGNTPRSRITRTIFTGSRRCRKLASSSTSTCCRSIPKGLFGRTYVDPNGEKLDDGTIRAARISSKQALDRYG